MGRFAEGTSVSVERSRAEIERELTKYGATSFASGWDGSKAMIGFELEGRRIRFVLPLPDRQAPEFWRTPGRRRQRTSDEAFKAWEQACRQRWRALALAVKAKLEAVASGISTFEEEFLSRIVIPGDPQGRTVGEWARPALGEAYAGKPLPPLLPAPGETP